MRKEKSELKKLKNSFKIIDRLILKRSYSISSEDFGKDKFIFLRNGVGGFSFELEDTPLLLQSERFDFRNLLLERGKFNFKVNNLYTTQRTFRRISGLIGSFNSLNFDKSKQQFHRLIIPISQKPNFVFSIENISLEYEYKQRTSTRLAIEIDFPVGKFHLYQVSKKINDNTKPSYLVVDCSSLINFEDFSEICHSVLVCFGFITGSFIQNQGFFFQYNNGELNVPNSFYHTPFRKSIKASYVPIYSNPHGIIHSKEIADKYKIEVMSSYCFSRLCNITHLESDLKSALFLILETNSTSLVSSPGLLSIALETLANYVYKKNEKELTPIPDKKISQKLRSELKEVISNYSEKISDSAKSILNSRVDQINQRTNREKLLIPFELLQIKLTEMDIDAIEQRNSFLHGKIPMIQDHKPEDVSKEDKFKYFLHLKLFTLLSALILKLSEFNGHILNYPKIYESNTGIEVNEDYYRSI